MKQDAISPDKRKASRPLQQVAALPVRASASGGIEVLLVTSRDTGRWVLPKGGLMKGLDAPASAAAEAWEEAGVVGDLHPRPLGVYIYRKTGPGGRSRSAVVSVFRLDVVEERNEWPEMRQRERRWMSPADAASRVAERDLAALLAAFA